MFRLWKTTLPEAGSHPSRRGKRRFVPSLTSSASCLEDRVVLNGGGPFASVDQAAQALANTRAGQTVTNMFQSILMTNPTNAQMVQNVRRLRNGLGTNGLRNLLFSSAQREQLLSALNVNVNTSPQALVNSLFTNVLNQSPTPVATTPFVRALNAGANPQRVAQQFINAAGRSLTFSNATTPIAASNSFGTTSTTSTGTTSAATPIGQFAIGQFPLSQLPLSQLPITPVTSVRSPINSSPIASPLSVFGSPIINSPINASPVRSIPVVFPTR
jgi:hypothetical protein